jgi:uncharacterized protein Yka (UPF0111/DUF47 family)
MKTLAQLAEILNDIADSMRKISHELLLREIKE